jgi:hypothetical protein
MVLPSDTQVSSISRLETSLVLGFQQILTHEAEESSTLAKNFKRSVKKGATALKLQFSLGRSWYAEQEARMDMFTDHYSKEIVR